jgi:uncharacterized RDD family membrane protein YckC
MANNPNETPDYSTYTLEQLYDAHDHINKERYSERFEIILTEIQKRKSGVEPVGFNSEPKLKEKPKPDLKYKTFWPRFWAGIIDGLILGLLIYLPGKWLLGVDFPMANDQAFNYLIFNIIFSSSIYIYSVLMHGYYGQTIGKMCTGVKVLDISEKSLNMNQAIIRDLIPITISVITFIYMAIIVTNGTNPFSIDSKDNNMLIDNIGIIWFFIEIVTMLLSKKRRALHDYIAGSVVIRTSSIKPDYS